MNRWFSLTIVTLMILSIVFSQEIVYYINSWREYYNSLEELNTTQVILRLLLNYWEGFSIALNLSFLFVIAKLVETFNGIVNKIKAK
jgi:hypothetical protein